MGSPPPTERRSSPLSTRVARRIFVLFTACAMLPLAVFAVFAYAQVTEELYQQARGRLRQSAKALGMSTVERLVLLDSELESLARGGPDSEPELRFRSLALVTKRGELRRLFGSPPEPPELAEAHRAHLATGFPLVWIAEPDRVLVLRTGGRGELIYGEARPDFLWGALAAEHTGTVLVTQDGKVLYGESPGDRAVERLAGGGDAAGQDRAFAIELDGEPQLAGHWQVFLNARYATRPWELYHLQPQHEILAPISEFQLSFPLMVLLAFLIVLLLSHLHIRRVTEPLRELRRAAGRLGTRDYEARVTIESDDEFEELGDTFNRMAGALGEHVATLRTVNEIGRDLGEAGSDEQLLDRLMEGCRQATRAEAAILFLCDDQGRPRPHRARIPVLPASDSPERLARLRLGELAPELSHRVVCTTDCDPDGALEQPHLHRLASKYGYPCRSLLSVPMRDHEDELIGVLQLMNPRGADRNIERFSDDARDLAISLASQTAVALSKNRLANRFRMMFQGLVELMVAAIDEKSPYTGGHCRRVPILTMLLADAVSETRQGTFSDFSFSPQERYELELAALLHDIGKVVTPVHVQDKATKLEAIFDRIELVATRFEVMKRDATLRALEARSDEATVRAAAKACAPEIRRLESEIALLQEANVGSEAMPPETRQKIRRIARNHTWQGPNGEQPCLTDEEVENLTIRRGTLNDAEREIINYHVVATTNMLNQLPYPKHLRNVPAIAGSHHERCDGSGYPDGLGYDDITLQGRILGIADVFEALTAADRPYKKRMPLSQALRILNDMAKRNELDPEVFQVFLEEKVYLRYAAEYLDPEQVDVEDADLAGYLAPA